MEGSGYVDGHPVPTPQINSSGIATPERWCGVIAERAVDAVVFDYGGVLTSPVSETIAAWLNADGIDAMSFSRVLKAWMSRNAPDGTPIHRLETGELAVNEFERALAAELTTYDGTAVEPAGLMSRLFAHMRVDDSMFELAEQLRGHGVKVAMLSNSWGSTYPRERIDPLFDVVVISGEVGLRKPHAAIYELALDQLEVPAPRVVFLDDAEINVLGARAVGMQALLHRSPELTRQALCELAPWLGTRH